MNIGLYFGSFNPIHIGHLIIANHILNNTDLDKIWFVVSPQNPFKSSSSLLNEYDRLYFVQKAVEDNDRLKASDIEFTLAKPSYTAITLIYLQEKYPAYHFSIIMGSDGFQNFPKWKNAQQIAQSCSIILYKRPGFEIKNMVNAKLQIMDAPLLDISATYIRQLIKENKSIKYLVPPVIEEEIFNNSFYRRSQKK